MEEMTLDDLQSAIRGAHDVKPAPLTDADVAPKRSPLSTFVPGTQTNPILLPEQTITATPENDLTQDDIERVLSLAMTGGDEELPKDGRWHVPSVKDALAKAFEARQAMPGFLASTADVTVGNVLPTVAGGLTYPIARIFQMPPEKAQALREEVTGALDKPFGKALGLTESPSYTGSAPSQLMNYIGKYAHMGVDWLSKETGLPPGDVQSYIDSLTLAAPKIASTTGQGLKAGWDWMRESPPVKGVQQLTHELKTGETPPPPPAPIEPMMDVNQQPSQMIGGGAASTSPAAILQGNIDAAIADASPELQAHINAHPPENVNVPAVQTRALEEKHGVNLLTSQRTGDMPTYRKAWNERTANGLEEDFKAQPQQLYDAFEQSKQRHAPDISSQADASELGQHEINGLVETDKARIANIDKNYQDFRDAYIKFKQDAGLPIENDFPVNGKEFLSNANKALINESLQFEVPKPIQDLLDVIGKNKGTMSYQEFLNLDKRLSAKQREGTGSEREAAGVIRKQLNNIQLEDEAKILQPQYEKAKTSAKERFDVIDSNPAYKAAIDAAEDAKHSPDAVSLKAKDFHKTYVSSGNPEVIRRMKAEIPTDHIAHQAITWGELERAKQAITNASASRVNAETFAKFLRDSKPSLREALPPAAMQDVSEIGLLNSKMVKPDAGAFNYSNSYTNLFGDLARQGLLNAGELKLMSATGGASVPVVSGAKSLLQKFNKDAFANEQRNSYGGLTKE